MTRLIRRSLPAGLLLAGALIALGPVRADDTRAPRKVAFLVGVSKYDHITDDLNFAERDASEMAAALKGAGFEVVTLTGSARGDDRATKDNIEKRLNALLDGDRHYYVGFRLCLRPD
jgi:Caspase domain